MLFESPQVPLQNAAKLRRCGKSWPLLLCASLNCFAARSAVASHCEPHPLSSCVPSNQQWLAAAPSKFVALPSAEVLAAGRLSLALAGVYQHEPLVLQAPSPDPEGRSVPLVQHVVDSQALFAAGLGFGLELTSALRLVTYQQGSGIGAVRSRSTTSLAPSAIRDPLVGIAYELVGAEAPTRRYALKLRSDFSLPLGDPESFASEPGAVVAPGLTFQWEAGRVNATADLGLRVRPSVTLADVRYGDQLSAGAGVSVEVVRDTLLVAVEASALPGLEASPSTPDGAEVRWIPAEWASSLTWHVSATYSLSLSAGGGLPLSSRAPGAGSNLHDSGYFVGLGAPAVRSLLILRVTSPNE